MRRRRPAPEKGHVTGHRELAGGVRHEHRVAAAKLSEVSVRRRNGSCTIEDHDDTEPRVEQSRSGDLVPFGTEELFGTVASVDQSISRSVDQFIS